MSDFIEFDEDDLEGAEQPDDKPNEHDIDFDGLSLREAVIAYKALRVERDLAQATFKPLDEALKRAKARLNDIMRDPESGMDTIKIKGVGKFVAPEPTWYAQVQDRGALHKWAKDNRPGLLRTREEDALLNQLVRERINSGQALPPGLGAYPRKTVSIYKA